MSTSNPMATDALSVADKLDNTLHGSGDSGFYEDLYAALATQTPDLSARVDGAAGDALVQAGLFGMAYALIRNDEPWTRPQDIVEKAAIAVGYVWERWTAGDDPDVVPEPTTGKGQVA